MIAVNLYDSKPIAIENVNDRNVFKGILEAPLISPSIYTDAIAFSIQINTVQANNLEIILEGSLDGIKFDNIDSTNETFIFNGDRTKLFYFNNKVRFFRVDYLSGSGQLEYIICA